MSLDWARCAPFIDAALAHAGRTHALEHVAGMIEAGEAQLWAGDRSAMVTLVEDEPLERRLLIWLAARLSANSVRIGQPTGVAAPPML